jgi:hypothetical protein
MSTVLQTMVDELARVVVEFIYTKNSSKAAYHSNERMLAVTNTTRLILDVEGATDDEIITGTLAALFHDFDHTGGEEADSVNIRKATTALLVHRKLLVHVFPWITSKHIVDALKAIECTEYPFVHEPSCLVQKALRDADALYPAMVGDPEIIIHKLRQELAVPRNKLITYEDMIEMQHKFSNTIKLFTDTGTFLWNKKQIRYLDSISAYVAEGYAAAEGYEYYSVGAEE